MGPWGKVQRCPESPQTLNWTPCCKGSGTAGILVTWAPQAQTAPFHEAPEHGHLEPQRQPHRPPDLQQMPPGWDLQADVRQGWGPSSWLGIQRGLLVHTGFQTSTVPTPQPQKAVPYPVLPGLLQGCGPCLGQHLNLLASPSGGVTRQAPFSRSHRCTLHPEPQKGVFSVARRLYEGWSQCRKVGEARLHVR